MYRNHINLESMSSFTCSAKHFNSVSKALQEEAWMRLNCPSSLKDITPKFYNKRDYPSYEVKEEIDNMVTNLAKLNATCVTLQYAHHYKDVEAELAQSIEEATENTDVKGLTRLGLYHGLRCIYYQCETHHLSSDERVPTKNEQEAEIFLTEIINVLAHNLVEGMPADSSNGWSID